MRAIAVRRGEAGGVMLVGKIACHDVRDGEGRVAIRKGQTLDDGAGKLLLGLPWDEVHVLELEPGDLHEEPAGARLARAAVGAGVELHGYTGGQWTLTAVHRGLLRVHADALAQVNAEAGMAVFTLYDLQPVEAGEVVAKAKVTPLCIAERAVERVEACARAAGGLLAVRPFGPHTIGAVTRESLDGRQRARFEAALQEKVDWFGSRLLPVRYSGGDGRAVAGEIGALLEAGADVVIVAGASALDPLDPVFLGIGLAGGRMERVGVPAHPGSLLFAGEVQRRPVLGMPTCGMFSQATTFDLLLPRLLAGEPVGNAELAGLGMGGLLSQDSAFRFPPYRKTAARGELPE